MKIISAIDENNMITRQELADKLDLTINGIDWHIKKLKDEGILKRIGSKIAGHWEAIDK